MSSTVLQQHQREARPFSLMCVAALSDGPLLSQWEAHLLPLQQAGLLTCWSERQISAGAERMSELASHLERADGVILLLSADFFADDTCRALMHEAVERKLRNGTHIIPLIVRPVAWEESELGTFTSLPANGIAITTWASPDEGWQQAVRGLQRLLGLPARRNTPVVGASERERILRLLRRTYQTLLDGLLQGITWIELGLSERPESVFNASHLLHQLPDRAERPLPEGTSILSVFDQAEGELLILGVPGVGKSTLLLHLAMDLIARAEADTAYPLPIIVPLSSWGGSSLSLNMWLAEQLARIYNVPRKLGERWIEEGQVLPLFDGLDEMEELARPQCIAAINIFRRSRFGMPLVVCSRKAEYDVASMKEQLLLQNAVIVQPLTTVQAENVIRKCGPTLSGLHDALITNPALQDLITTPLMLNVMILVYRGVTPHNLPFEQIRLVESIWTDYVERMVREKGAVRQSKQDRPVKRYTLDQTRSWLSYLAEQMSKHNLTAFELEILQSDWLDQWPRLYKWYEWSLGLVVGLLGTLIFALAFALFLNPTGILIIVLVEVLIFVLAGGFVGGVIEAPDTTVIIERDLDVVPKQYVEVHLLPATTNIRFSFAHGLFHIGDDPIITLAIVGICAAIFTMAGGLATFVARGLTFVLAGTLIGALTGILMGLMIYLFCPLVRHYLIRFWLWRAGIFPLHATAFLEDARARHLLSHLGGNYQFIHQLLLEYFAAQNESAPTERISGEGQGE
ncbi:TIR domain-containing protein [Ktedonospora formicarum]|uniref:TIR domain-containing protein n=1 Tax=Ktedonospora formicarum TaxID=2778364 RepID=A0A8J3HY09_9CHLR|nr:TIR domain-containing protein [Ktedonospora formicarum]GHO45824.1 hypothetical protein KSX_39870 [Ktedonospora formicarum]